MDRAKNEILLLLTDRWCDWEAGYAIAVANSFSDYEVKTIAADYDAKVSMGCLKTQVDYVIDDYNDFHSLAMVIIPGGLSWEEDSHDDIATFVGAAAGHGVRIAAICGAAFFLCSHGFLDHVKHTGDSLELFQSAPGYRGADLYIQAQVVTDGGFITANETAAVEFAYEIFKMLEVDSKEEMDIWYNNFNLGAVSSPVIDHIHVTVSDIGRAEQFYDRLLPMLGFDLSLKEKDSVPDHEYQIIEYHNKKLSFGIVNQRREYENERVSRRKAGALHHLAFYVKSKKKVDELFKMVKEISAVIVHEPRYYREYCKDYYAFFFKDSENIEYEIVNFMRENSFPAGK